MRKVIDNITPLQWLGIVILLNGTLIGGSNYLKDIGLPVGIITAIIGVASLGNMFLGGLVTMFSSPGNLAKTADQETMVRQVLDMPGVQRIDVNTKANQTLAALAIDPTLSKIGPTPAAQITVEKTAAQRPD